MKVTQEEIDALVYELVPEEYHPAPYEHANPPTVTNISVMEREKLEERAAKAFPGEEQGPGGRKIGVSGIHYNWGLLRKSARLPDWDKWAKSSSIFIADDIIGGKFQLSFIILHEIGHVDWNMRRDKLRFWREEDEELYCDTYAYEILKGKYDEGTAFVIAQLFGSVDGMGNLND